MHSLLALWRLPPVSRRALLVTWRNLTVWRKYIASSIVGNFVDPLIFLAGMGIGLGALVRSQQVGGVSYAAFIAPGLAAATVMNTASFECTFGSFTRMTTQRTYAGIIVTPINIEEVALGDILFASLKATVGGLAVLLVATAFGLIAPVGLLPSLAVAALGGFGFAALAMIVTALAPSYDFFSYYLTLVVTPMFLFSGIFFPLEKPWMKSVAFWLPLTHLVNLIRGLSLGAPFSAGWADAVWLVAFALLLYPPAVNLIARRLVK